MKPRTDEVDEQEYQQSLLGDRECRPAELEAIDYEDVNHCPHGVPYTEVCETCVESLQYNIR